jgi:hypothetical protein
MLLAMAVISFILLLFIKWSHHNDVQNISFGGCAVHVLCMYVVGESVKININQQQSQTLKEIRKYCSWVKVLLTCM